MTQPVELPVLVSLEPMNFDRYILRQNLYTGGVHVTDDARQLIGCIEHPSLDYPVDIVLVGATNLPGYFERMDSPGYQAGGEAGDAMWSRFYEDVTDRATWIDAVEKGLGLEACPEVVGPMIALSLVGKDCPMFAVAMKAVTNPEGDAPARIFALFGGKEGPTLATESWSAWPSPDADCELWAFARRR